MTCLTARVQIPRFDADVDVPRFDAAVDTGLRNIHPRAQIGRVADAVEVWDPHALLTALEDTEDGVRIGLTQGQGSHVTPHDAVCVSIPLRDSTGRPITEIGPHLIEGYCRAILRQEPATQPSGMGIFVGVVVGGPLSTATRGVVWSLLHAPGGVQAGMWRTGWQYLTPQGAWSESRATWNVDDPLGIHGTWGQLPGAPGQFQGLSTVPLRNANTGTSIQGFPGVQLAGPDPHLVFGALWADPPTAPDEVSFLPLGKWQQPDEVT